MSLSFIPTTLYYASAAIHAVSIPGHIVFGIKHVDPAVSRIPSDPELAIGKATATTAWDMVNALLGASGITFSSTFVRLGVLMALIFVALLNVQWARVGVRTFEEQVIVWTTVLAGSLVGTRYFRVQSYAGLGCLWVAPWMTLGAMVWEKF